MNFVMWLDIKAPTWQRHMASPRLCLQQMLQVVIKSNSQTNIVFNNCRAIKHVGRLSFGPVRLQTEFNLCQIQRKQAGVIILVTVLYKLTFSQYYIISLLAVMCKILFSKQYFILKIQNSILFCISKILLSVYFILYFQNTFPSILLFSKYFF